MKGGKEAKAILDLGIGLKICKIFDNCLDMQVNFHNMSNETLYMQ